jgi:hypothetical protein
MFLKWYSQVVQMVYDSLQMHIFEIVFSSMIPHKGIFLKLPSHPTFIRLIWSLGIDKICSILTLHIF